MNERRSEALKVKMTSSANCYAKEQQYFIIDGEQAEEIKI